MVTAESIRLCDGFREKFQQQVDREMVPMKFFARVQQPHSLHYFCYPYLLGIWAGTREALLVSGHLKRVQKEMLAAFVSRSNECRFCTNAHTLFGLSQGADSGFQRAVAEKDPSLLADKKMAGIAEWMVAAQQKDSPVLNKVPPFTSAEAPEIIFTAFLFNYMNRMVYVFLTRDEYSPSVPTLLKLMFRLMPFTQAFFEKHFLVKGASKASPAEPGKFSSLAESEIVIPEDLEWTSSNPAIQKAHSYWRMASDELGRKYVPEVVRQFVGKYIRENYDGEKPPLSRMWVFDVTDSYIGSEKEKSAIRFMLLVAFAMYQVDETILRDLAKHYPDKDTQKALGMWTAYQTARVIAEWQAKALQNAN